MAGDTENWMRNLPQELAQKPLTQLKIPGSHDSFTYSLSTANPIPPVEPKSIQKLGKLPCVKKIIYNWSVTQKYDVTAQLKAGIRYLDFRTCYFPEHDTFNAIHGLYGGDFGPIFDQINTFLSEHPDECVLLSFHSMDNFTDKLHERFTTMIKQAFSGKLCPFPPADHGPLSLSWLRSHGYQAIAIYNSFENHGLWPGDYLVDPWANTDDLKTLINYLTKHLSNKHTSGNVFYDSQGIRTESHKDVALHLGSNLIDYIGSSTTKAVVQWAEGLSSDLRNKLNIVSADVVNMHEFTPSIIKLNYL